MNAHKDILLIEDEPGYRNIINKRLRLAGYHVILAQNAEEALVALWEKEHIGLVLLDVRLPVMNGLNIFEILRKDFPDKKAIIISVLQKEEQRFLIYDADDYYDKSEDLSNLVEKIDNVFSTRRMGSVRENEKRLFKRIPVNVLASFEKNHPETFEPTTHFLSYTKDLSPSGGKFIVSENIEVGQHFTMSLELPVNFLPLLIDCEVVWVRKTEGIDPASRGNVVAGVRFVKLDSPRDEEKLKNYLYCV